MTTAFPDYALESYELNVVDYLLKPFSFQRFVKAVSKVRSQKEEHAIPRPPVPSPLPHQEVFVKSGYEFIKVHLPDISFIQADADYTELNVKGKKVLSSEPLRYWLDTLPADRFVQVHKSYIVNVADIEKVAGNQVYLSEGAVIPIGRAYKEDFINRFVR